ncbi:metal ABC transporter permease [Caldalkalibacillus mannanilyticus]|uniref:metal ABC transporter permease n=1 Tax=Caldalkalibacillus mannanilyticus TaxID=1418 RepID=UPI000A3E0985|nr:metal ABC transporter permease [Caldalkalibacillus mannanilyticus]
MMIIQSLYQFIDSLFRYTYLQQALIASILVGIICGVIGCFIILRGMALMGDAISHAVLPGVAISYMLGIGFFWGAVVTGVLTAIGIGYISQNTRIKEDSAIGIMFTAAFALGIVLINLMRGVSVDLYHILFGNVLGVSSQDLVIVAVIGVIVLAVIILFFKELLISTFDPIMSKAIGLPTNLIHYFLMLLLSLVTVASLKTVGIVLVVAMLITPGATAYLLTDRLSIMLWISSFIGVLSSVSGLFLSYTLDVSSGAAIVLVATFFFMLAMLFSPKQGILSKAIKTRRLRKAINE